MRSLIRACWLGLLLCAPAVGADGLDEYRLKAAFLYNFVSFTVWPAGVGNVLNLCLYGPDHAGLEIDQLQGGKLAERSLVVWRMNSVDALGNCQIVFISRSVIGNLPRVIDALKDKPALTVADSPGAARDGAAINMVIKQNRILFEVNLGAAQGNGLALSSKLLRLANEVYP